MLFFFFFSILLFYFFFFFKFFFNSFCSLKNKIIIKIIFYYIIIFIIILFFIIIIIFNMFFFFFKLNYFFFFDSPLLCNLVNPVDIAKQSEILETPLVKPILLKQNCELLLVNGAVKIIPISPIHDILVCEIRPEGIRLSLWETIQIFLKDRFNEETQLYHFSLSDLHHLEAHMKKNYSIEDASVLGQELGFIGSFLLPNGVKLNVVKFLGNNNDIFLCQIQTDIMHLPDLAIMQDFLEPRIYGETKLYKLSRNDILFLEQKFTYLTYPNTYIEETSKITKVLSAMRWVSGGLLVISGCCFAIAIIGFFFSGR